MSWEGEDPATPAANPDVRTLELFTHDSTETEAEYESDLIKNGFPELRSFIERHEVLDGAHHQKLVHLYQALRALKNNPDASGSDYVKIANQAAPFIGDIMAHDRSHKAARAARKHSYASKVAKDDVELNRALKDISDDLTKRFPLTARSGSKKLLDVENKFHYEIVEKQIAAVRNFWSKRRGFERASKEILAGLKNHARNLVEQTPGLGRKEQVSAAEQRDPSYKQVASWKPQHGERPDARAPGSAPANRAPANRVHTG